MYGYEGRANGPSEASGNFVIHMHLQVSLGHSKRQESNIYNYKVQTTHVISILNQRTQLGKTNYLTFPTRHKKQTLCITHTLFILLCILGLGKSAMMASPNLFAFTN